MKYNVISLRDEIRTFVDEQSFKNPMAVTLTMRRVLARNGVRYWIDGQQCKQNLRHFLNVISRRLFRGDARRGKRLRCFSVLEYSETVRPHYHLIVENPTSMSAGFFRLLLQSFWSRTTWGYRQIEAVSCDSGWNKYMTKLRTKPDFDLAIDWENSHF